MPAKCGSARWRITSARSSGCFDWVEQRVIYVNPAYEKVWGRSGSRLLNAYDEWADSIHPDDREIATASFAAIVETGGGEPREYRIVRPDGEVRWILDRGFVIRDENGPGCADCRDC